MCTACYSDRLLPCMPPCHAQPPPLCHAQPPLCHAHPLPGVPPTMHAPTMHAPHHACTPLCVDPVHLF